MGLMDSLFGGGSSEPKTKLAPKEAQIPGCKLATFACGCFWGPELLYQRVPGVEATSVGYTAGSKPGPSYQEVCSGNTGHTEAVQVTYNPTQVTYDQLLDTFFGFTDPTTKNRLDFMFRKEKDGVAPLVKPPGSIAGNGFLLDRIENCEVCVCDHTSQVQIDDCVNCKIFIGPCDGSVFIRDTMDCSLCVCCRQLRTRDCKNLDISLFCATQPSLETSTGIQITPWRGSYPGIEEHMRLANLDAAKNLWDQVYDFSAGVELEGGAQHWRLDHSPHPQWTTPLSTPAAAAPAGTDMMGAETELASFPEESLPLPPFAQSLQQEEEQPFAPITPPLFAPMQLIPAEQEQQQQQQQHVGINGFTTAGDQSVPAQLGVEDARERWQAENRVRLASVKQAEEERRRQMREKAAQTLQEGKQSRESRRQARHAKIISQAQTSMASFKADQGVSGNGGATGWAKVTHLLRDPATGTIRQVLGMEGPLRTLTVQGQGQGQERTTIAAQAPTQAGGSLKDVGRMREVLLSLAQQQQQQQLLL